MTTRRGAKLGPQTKPCMAPTALEPPVGYRIPY